MKSPRRVQADVQPEIIQKLGDGTFYYNYDVQEVQVEGTNPDTQEPEMQTKYEFIQVMLRGVPEYKHLVLAILREYLTQDEEFDLINSYNEAITDGETSCEEIDEYKEYLTLRNTIKKNIKKDLNK